MASAETEPRARVDLARGVLDRVEAALRREGLTVEVLGQLRTDLDPIPDRLAEVIRTVEPEAKALRDRLAELGDKPEDASAEAPEIAREREELTAKLAALDADLRQARAQSVRNDQLTERIVERRRDLFSRQLLQRAAGPAEPSFWFDLAATAPIAARGLGFLIEDWVAVVARFGAAAGVALIGALLVAAVLMFGPVRRALAGLVSRRFVAAAASGPTPVQVAARAVVDAILNAILPILGIRLVLHVLDWSGLLPGRLIIVAEGIAGGLTVYVALAAVAGAILAPGRPDWRFLPVSEPVAHRAHATAILTGMVAAVLVALQGLSTAIVAPLPFVVALSSATALLFAVVLATGLVAVGNAMAQERRARTGDPYESAPPPLHPAWRWIRIGSWLAAAVLVVAVAGGYAAFASFLVSQVVWAFVIMGMLALATTFIDALAAEVTAANGATARRIADAIGVEAASVEQVGIIASGALRLLAIVLAVFLIVAPWGVDQRDAFGWVRAAFFGVQIGGITISLAAVVGAILVFVVGLVATRMVQRWLDDRYLPATRMDAGLRNSIRTAAGYLGFVLAAVLAVSYVGLDVQNLAIVAGALSVGLGFGLQSIVNNFVSGLILLAERPIKAGDWIVVGENEGYVRKINVRSTEIETFDRAVVIIPNSNLISGTVRNWMHNDLIGRTKVTVRVKRDLDPELVQATLIAIAGTHPHVLCDPAPKAYLMDITETALVFELAASVGNVDRAFRVRSDLRIEIIKTFRDKGIALAGAA